MGKAKIQMGVLMITIKLATLAVVTASDFHQLILKIDVLGHAFEIVSAQTCEQSSNGFDERPAR